MIGIIEEDIIINGDDKVKKGDYFIFKSNPKGEEEPMLVHKITTTEYITYKLKDKRQKILQVISLSPTFKFKSIYE